MKTDLYATAFALSLMACATDNTPNPVCGDGVCDVDESPASCPQDCPTSGPYCGDGVCDNGETHTTCAADCPATACTTSPDNCAGENICVSGACVNAFGRHYTISNISISVPTTDPSGQSWDIGGGAPDLFLGSQDGTMVFSNVVQDHFSATFPGPFDFVALAGGAMVFYFWDQDVSVNDFAFGVQWNPITAAQLRLRTLSYSGNGDTMTATIAPN